MKNAFWEYKGKIKPLTKEKLYELAKVRKKESGKRGGACCRYVSFPVDPDRDVKMWMETRGVVKDGWWTMKCACKYLKKGRCSIYATRPDVCKNYPPGSEPCLKVAKLWRKDNSAKIT